MSDKWIRRALPRTDPAARVICFPHAGGSANYFTPLARKLPRAIELLAVQNPGRQERYREPRLESIVELAEAVLPSVSTWLDRPTILFGHSMGAAQAFEVARGLPGGAPVVLFASARRAPSVIRVETVHQRSDRAIIAEMRALGGTDTRVFDDEETAALYLPVIRSDYRAVETYRCPAEVTVDYPITALVGDRDPRVTRADVEAWRTHTTAEFTTHVLPGGHFYLGDELDAVAELLGARLSVGTGETGDHRG
ncbi:thioesterase II family protein [Nocardia noduli]|uniref:thioesterase II family protein n=1 Tax=Nocardia noduli TaxID=2815722 RepID=UPI001C22C843|nr:alpha/beta fold hydrolase [Nocardia noduli]